MAISVCVVSESGASVVADGALATLAGGQVLHGLLELTVEHRRLTGHQLQLRQLKHDTTRQYNHVDVGDFVTTSKLLSNNTLKNIMFPVN